MSQTYTGDIELTREQAEKLIRRMMSPVRELLMSVEPDVHTVNSETGQLFDADGNEVHPVDGNTKLSITVGVLRDLNRDVALLGMCLAQKFRVESEYHTAYEVLTRDMVRLYNTIETLTEIKTAQNEEASDLPQLSSAT